MNAPIVGGKAGLDAFGEARERRIGTERCSGMSGELDLWNHTDVTLCRVGENLLYVYVVFELIDENNLVSDKTGREFCNELIDQQVRYNTNLQFGHIRDLIVKEAFKPVNK